MLRLYPLSRYSGGGQGWGPAGERMQNAEWRMQNQEEDVKRRTAATTSLSLFCILHSSFCISLTPTLALPGVPGEGTRAEGDWLLQRFISQKISGGAASTGRDGHARCLPQGRRTP